MREKILKAIESTKQSGHKFEPLIAFKDKHIKNAMKHIVKSAMVSESDIVAMMDTTLFRSCKDGYVFTNNALYSDHMKQPLMLNEIVKAENSTKTTYDSIITLKNGEKVTVFTSAYRDYINKLLNKIAGADKEEKKPKDADTEKAKKAETEPESMPDKELVNEKARLEAEKKRIMEELARIEAQEKVAAEKAAAEKAAADKAAAEKAEQDRIQKERINAIVEELKEKIEKAKETRAALDAEAQAPAEEKPVAKKKSKSPMFTIDDDAYIEELEKENAEFIEKIKAQTQKRAEEKASEQLKKEQKEQDEFDRMVEKVIQKERARNAPPRTMTKEEEYKYTLENLALLSKPVPEAFNNKYYSDGHGNGIYAETESTLNAINDALKLEEKGKYDEAMKAFREIGNPYCYFAAGRIASKLGDEKNAISYLKASAASGYCPAAEMLVRYYSNDEYRAKIRNWWTADCDDMEILLRNLLLYAGYEDAIYHYACRAVENKVINEKMGRSIFIIARYRAEKSHSDAMDALQLCYREGIGTEIDLEKSENIEMVLLGEW